MLSVSLTGLTVMQGPCMTGWRSCKTLHDHQASCKAAYSLHLSGSAKRKTDFSKRTLYFLKESRNQNGQNGTAKRYWFYWANEKAKRKTESKRNLAKRSKRKRWNGETERQNGETETDKTVKRQNGQRKSKRMGKPKRAKRRVETDKTDI